MYLQSDKSTLDICYTSLTSCFSWLLSWHKLLYWSQASYASCGDDVAQYMQIYPQMLHLRGLGEWCTNYSRLLMILARSE